MTRHSKITTAALSIAHADLKQVLRSLAHTDFRRSAIAVVRSIRIKACAKSQTVAFTATDLDAWCTHTAEAVVDQDAEFLVPRAALQAMAGAADGAAIRLEPDATGEFLTATIGEQVMRLRLLLPAADFPEAPARDAETRLSPNGLPSIQLGENDLHRLLHLAQPCVSTEETRYYLNGVFFTTKPDSGTLRAVAMDGHTLACIDCDTDMGGLRDAILPRTVVSALLANLKPGGNRDVTLRMTRLMAVIEVGDIRIITRMIDGTYPEYTRAIPAPSDVASVTVLPAAMRKLRMLARVVRTSSFFESCTPVTLDAESKVMRVNGLDEGSQVEVPVSATGDLTFGLNLHYIEKIARRAGTVKISGKGANDPFRVTSEDPDALFVIMPMRL